MKNPTATKWDRLTENFETMSLLQAVDAVDRLRERVSDDGHRPPELRDRLLKLHELAMDVISRGHKAKIGAMFDLANELSTDVDDMVEALRVIQNSVEELVALDPRY